MTQGIDFLRAEKEARLAKIKARRPVKVGSIVFLVFYCLVVGATFSFWLALSQSSEQIKQKISLNKQRISSLKKTESLQVLLKQRLTLLAKVVFEEKPSYSQILVYFEEISPDGLILDSFKLTNKGEVDVAGSASNVVVLSNFLEDLVIKESKEANFSEITLSSLSRGPDGDYKFGLRLKTDEKL